MAAAMILIIAAETIIRVDQGGGVTISTVSAAHRSTAPIHRRSPPEESRGPTGNAPECLIIKFGRHKTLSEAEREFLRDLQHEERGFERGREIIIQGERSPNLFVLKSGWAYSHKLLANGKRQVLEILLPGDLLGMREYAFSGALNFVTTLTSATVCPFPRTRLRDFYRDQAGLTGVLCDILMREQAVLIERIADIGSRSAYQRVAHLFMELYVRLGWIGLREGSSFEFPMSQTILGEALGLSRVHIARTIRELRRRKLLELDRRTATVLDERGLIEAAEFEEFYLEETDK